MMKRAVAKMRLYRRRFGIVWVPPTTSILRSEREMNADMPICILPELLGAHSGERRANAGDERAASRRAADSGSRQVLGDGLS